MIKDPKVFLHHILDSIAAIESFIQNVNFSSFSQDRKTQDAVVREIEIIGEATSNLEGEFKQLYPQIPWQKIKAMRNKLTHDYWDIDLKLVWGVATNRCQELKNLLLPILRQLETQENSSNSQQSESSPL